MYTARDRRQAPHLSAVGAEDLESRVAKKTSQNEEGAKRTDEVMNFFF